jgi:hypothetical protein
VSCWRILSLLWPFEILSIFFTKGSPSPCKTAHSFGARQAACLASPFDFPDFMKNAALFCFHGRRESCPTHIDILDIGINLNLLLIGEFKIPFQTRFLTVGSLPARILTVELFWFSGRWVYVHTLRQKKMFATLR